MKYTAKVVLIHLTFEMPEGVTIAFVYFANWFFAFNVSSKIYNASIRFISGLPVEKT